MEKVPSYLELQILRVYAPGVHAVNLILSFC